MGNKIAILGAGTWGCTLANLLAEKEFSISLWDGDPEVISSLRETKIPKKLPDLTILESVNLGYDLKITLKDAYAVLIVVPSHSVREVFGKSSKFLNKNSLIVMCSKGMEDKTGLTLSKVTEEVFGSDIKKRYSVLSGPSHAEEVCQHKPTTVVVASLSPEVAQKCQELMMTNYFRVYTQNDVKGVELAGALKNVIAIAAGICDGLGLGDNSKAALLTRGLAEITRLGVALGARPETFAGLAGIGDLIVTATSYFSRNRNFGELLALNYSVEQAQNEIGMVVEGIRTTYSAHHLAIRYEIPMPIVQEVYRIIYEGKSPVDAVNSLMERSPKPEIY